MGSGGAPRVDVTADGQWIVFCRNRRLLRRNVQSGEEKQLDGPTVYPGHLALSPGGGRLAWVIGSSAHSRYTSRAMRLSTLAFGERSPAVAGLAALVLGLAAGIGVSAAQSGILNGLAAVIEPLGTLWVNAIRMILVPLVVSLLVTSVTSFSDARALGRLGARTATIFVLLLAGAAVFAALVGPPLFERMPNSREATATLRAAMQAPVQGAAPELPTLRGFIVGLVPTNPIRAAADGAMLPLIMFTLLFALATTKLPGEARTLVVGFFRAVGQAMLVIAEWILRLTPIGVFALALEMGRDLGLATAGAVV